MLKQVRFIREDRGNFRNYYKTVPDRLLYCTQPAEGLTMPQWRAAGEPLDWYICSKDGEPCHRSSHTFEIVA